MTNLTNTLSQVDHLLNTRVFLGFEADPSLNIVSRIRGPNVSFFFTHLSHFFLASSFLFPLVSLFDLFVSFYTFSFMGGDVGCCYALSMEGVDRELC